MPDTLHEKLPLSGRGRRIAFLALTGAAALAVVLFVDLSPRVDRDFFFSSDDPQLQQDRRILELFPLRPQLIVSAAGDILSLDYARRVGRLSQDLANVDGVLRIRDIHHGPDHMEDALENALWRRLLISEDRGATNLILTLDTSEPSEFRSVIAGIERAVERHRAEGFELAISGVPYVVEQIRRSVLRDLKVFGVAVVVAFGLVVLLLYHSGWILVGTMTAAGLASLLTLLARPLLGLEPDVLTPNITTVVFVLTLSHVVFLTANWKNAAREPGPGDERDGAGGDARGDDLIVRAVRWTGPASFWAMTTTLLGFLSLLLASAKPVRNFGLSCAVGSVLAFLGAYVVYPAYLGRADPAREVTPGLDRRMGAVFARRNDAAVVLLLLAVLVAAPGLASLNTDPSLFAYFDEDSRIAQGLERVDRTGGSSPLELVIRLPGGGELSEDEAFERMWRLQLQLERDPAVGSVISLPVLMAEAKDETPWPLNEILSWDRFLEEMRKPEFDRIARAFITRDHRHGRFMLRMKEAGREEPRDAVVGRLEALVRDHGFTPALTGGLYRLQGQLAELVRSSLVTGLVGLILLFSIVAYVVSRSLPVAAVMTATLVMIPVALLGTLGHLGTPLDVVSVPAAALALAIGVDDLVHLVFHARRTGRREPAGDGGSVLAGWEVWVDARRALWRAVLGSSLVVTIGFGLLFLSAFPSTRRLGLSVVLGVAAAIFLVLLVFPRLAELSTRIAASGRAEG